MENLYNDLAERPFQQVAVSSPEGEFLDKILRGEISAVEAYTKTLERFGSEPEANHLRRFRDEHEDSVRRLRDMIRIEGQIPSDESGLWGGIVATVVGAAKLTGNEASLLALRSGEEHGLKLYQEALEFDLSEEQKMVIRQVLIPRQEQHISSLSALASMQ